MTALERGDAVYAFAQSIRAGENIQVECLDTASLKLHAAKMHRDAPSDAI